MSNPLLGKRISLISKKNIRYEGVLYSINEQNATVALQNVRTFGTEGRESSEQGCIFVAPTETVHPYLLFRGQDIKDLHVHESEAAAAAAVGEAAPGKKEAAAEKAPPTATKTAATKSTTAASAKAKTEPSARSADENKKQPSVNKGATTTGGGGGYNRRQRSQKAAVGTGASLLNRSVRGAVSGSSPEAPQGDFDFQSSLEQFQKEGASEDEEEAGDDPTGIAYAKDDFFDSISCDALDKQSGIDNRVRGSAERHLNTETFGAVALNTHRRRRGRGGGRGRGRYGGRGRGRGRGGRGRGSYHRSNNPGSSSQSGGQQHASAAVS